jgi:DNA mismatch repair protein MutS2
VEARQAALPAQAEAERSREALQQRLTDLQRQAEQDTRLAEARARVQPGDRVVVARFGYDRPGRIVKLDPRKKTAMVAIGPMQWSVAIDELIPQVLRTPETREDVKPRGTAPKAAPRLEDFGDELPAS